MTKEQNTMAQTTKPTIKRAAIILAAGKSTRMKSSRSKVLHEIGGRALLEWVTDLSRSVGVDKIVCVVGAQNTDVRAKAESLGLDIAVQEPQRGTADAVGAAQQALAGFEGNVIVLCADAPLITKQTVLNAFEALECGADAVAVGFKVDDPASYGRLIIEDGVLSKIVEAKECNSEQLLVNYCNAGVVAADCTHLFNAIDQIDDKNAKGEFYLTDVFEITNKMSEKSVAVEADPDEVLGINSRSDLALAEQAFQTRKRQEMLDNGVTLRDPNTVIFAWDTQIEQDVEIGANVVFGPDVSIGTGTVIHPFCHVEGTHIAKNAQIGPFARLRPGTKMADNTKIGNFVETKKVDIGQGSKVNHLSYIGDAKIGRGVNIGAGTITCNYDGYNKHLTTIEDGVFVGTHSSLVAPLTIGAGAYLGTGGVITKNVPADALALARSEQVHKEGWGKRYRTVQEAKKAKKKK